MHELIGRMIGEAIFGLAFGLITALALVNILVRLVDISPAVAFPIFWGVYGAIVLALPLRLAIGHFLRA